MELKYLKQNLEKSKKKNGITYLLGKPVSKEEIESLEYRIKIHFPNQVKLFFMTHNGLKIQNPDLEIFPINELVCVTKKRIKFCKIDNIHEIGFDISKLNSAGQWNILNLSTNFVITLTMASFWSNKIWAWVNNRREIWKKEIYEEIPKKTELFQSQNLLTRYWFSNNDNLGYGVTAFSVEDANSLLKRASLETDDQHPISDIDIRTLDQGHVIPNMGPPNIRGIWFPKLNI